MGEMADEQFVDMLATVQGQAISAERYRALLAAEAALADARSRAERAEEELARTQFLLDEEMTARESEQEATTRLAESQHRYVAENAALAVQVAALRAALQHHIGTRGHTRDCSKYTESRAIWSCSQRCQETRSLLAQPAPTRGAAILEALGRVLDAAPLQGGGTRINLAAMVDAVDAPRALHAAQERPGGEGAG
jgi:hypothetical protein